MNRSKSIFAFQVLWIILSTLQTTFAQIPSRQKPNIIYAVVDNQAHQPAIPEILMLKHLILML